MTLDASGRLLVGTTSATANFNVLASQSVDGAAGMMVENTSNTSSASAIVRYNNSNSAITAYTGIGSPSRSSYATLGANVLSMYTSSTAGMSFSVDAAGPIKFATNATQRMEIDSSGNLGFSTAGKGILGTTTNNNADAGVVGEFVSSTVASIGVSMTSGTPIDITSINLTAGDWDVSGVIGITNTLGTTTYSFITYSSSTTSATIGSLGQAGGLTPPSTISATVDFVTPIPTTRYSLASTTTIYLVARAGFAVSNSYAYGVIRARRVR
jgi:hypothetical protein